MSTKGRFESLDGAIVAAISHGAVTFAALCSHPELAPTAESMGSRALSGDRVIDRRLQALKKAGAICYVNRRWEVA